MNRSLARRAIVLAALALSAHFIALGVGALMTARLPETHLCGPFAVARTPHRDRHAATEALLRWLGDDAPIDPAPGGPATDVGCEDAPRRLVATVLPRSGRSFAAIVDASGRAALFEEGELSSGATVARIDPEAVTLTVGEHRCVLTMFSSAPAGPPSEDAPLASESAVEGIHRIDDDHLLVDRALLDTLIADPSPLLRSARLVPHEEEGRIVGMRVYGVRRGSLADALGLVNGDTLRSVNGIALTGPSAAVDLLGLTRGAAPLEVLLERGGVVHSLEVRFTPHDR